MNGLEIEIETASSNNSSECITIEYGMHVLVC